VDGGLAAAGSHVAIGADRASHRAALHLVLQTQEHDRHRRTPGGNLLTYLTYWPRSHAYSRIGSCSK